MNVTLSTVDISDAESLARNVDVPATRDGPLYRLMFPPWDDMSDVQRDVMLQWCVEGLRNAIERQADNFLQIRASDGTPLGFCGWVFEDEQETAAGTETALLGSSQRFVPENMDVPAWLSISKHLRQERERALEGLVQACRLTFMSVHPEYQRRGLGSIMLQRFCDEVDGLGYTAYVMASPAGVRLYEKFGFDAVGRVELSRGTFTSMLRKPRLR